MPRIERGQFADFLRRYLSMTGESDVARELAPEVSPIFVLEAERPEWEFLKGAKLMSMVTAIGSGGTGPSIARIRNPANSGVVAIVYKWDVGNRTGAINVYNLFRQLSNVDLAASVTPIPRDTRYPGGAVAQSALIGSQTNLAGAPALGELFWSASLPTNEQDSWWGHGGFVLTPGWALSMASVGTGEMQGGVSWLEKRLDELERQ